MFAPISLAGQLGAVKACRPGAGSIAVPSKFATEHFVTDSGFVDSPGPTSVRMFFTFPSGASAVKGTVWITWLLIVKSVIPTGGWPAACVKSSEWFASVLAAVHGASTLQFPEKKLS